MDRKLERVGPYDPGGSINIEVQCYGGARIEDAIADMTCLAGKLGISVWCSLNGVRTLARPNDDPEALYNAWNDAMDNKLPHKYASVRRSA